MSLHSAAFKRHVAGREVMERRRAWRVGPSSFEVVSRAADRRYRVSVLGDGRLECSCTAAEYGLGCWHVDAVMRRLENEGGVK